VQVEKNELNKQLHALEAENVELITDWNEIEIKLEVLKSENMALKRQVKDGKGEIRFYAHKEVAAELRFQKQKKKRKRVETEKGEKDRELEEEEQEIRKVKEENAALARTLEDAMKQLERLEWRVRKFKKPEEDRALEKVKQEIRKVKKENATLKLGKDR
jgi:chromosome segregation ATPase